MKKLEEGLDEEIDKGVALLLEEVQNGVSKGIIDKTIVMKERRCVSDIIQQKENKRFTIEGAIRQQKLKEKQDIKEQIEGKLKGLEENMKLLENNDITKVDLNLSAVGKEVLDENIRRSKLKEIKQTKDYLEKRLFEIDEHIKELIDEENDEKKFDFRSYLDNFEKDRKEAEARIRRIEREKEERNRALSEQRKANEMKKKNTVDKSEKEYLEREAKKKQDYERKLEKMKEKTTKYHKEMENLQNEMKSRIILEKQYKYQVAEEEFKQKQDKMEEERRNKFLMEHMKKRSLLKPLNRDELNEFSKKYMEERQRLLYEKEKERLLKQEELMNTKLPGSETQFYQKIIEEEKQTKELKEKEKLDKIYLQMKVKQFSKDVKEKLPEIDKTKVKKESPEEKPKVKKHVRKTFGPLFKVKKSKSPEHINTSVDSARSGRSEQNRSLSNKRKPLVKPPDYLTEIRVNKTREDKSSNSH